MHWAAENVVDYWQSQHNRNSIDGYGMAPRGYVHTTIPSNNPAFVNVNAYWHRTEKAMFYGDGNPLSGFGPIAAFDVTCHEFGHGVCQFTANLPGGTSEAAALNEGFSDIWGAAIEAWAAPTKQRWLMGEDIFPVCLRNLQNPNDPFASEVPHPDTYHGQFWDNAGEPHNNSTVLSHWYYLLSVGGSGTNDIGNNFIVNSIGIDKAAQITYKTETLLNSNADYAMARTMSIQAAQTIFGIGSCEEIAVTRAWYAVGVGADYVGALPPLPTSISGPQTFCQSGIYSLTGVPTGAVVTWSVSNPAITTITGNGNTATVTRVSNGLVTVSATITISGISCYPNTTVVSKDIEVNNVLPTTITTTNNYPACVNSVFTASIPSVTGATNYQWTVGSNLQILSGNGTNTITVQVLVGNGSNSIDVFATATPCNYQGTTNITLGEIWPPFPKGPIVYIVAKSCLLQTAIFGCKAVANASNYNWVIAERGNNGWARRTIYNTAVNQVTHTFSNLATSATVTAIATSPCGTTPEAAGSWLRSVECPNAYVHNDDIDKDASLAIYPNPASSNTTISLIDTKKSIKEIIIKNKMGLVMKHIKFKDGKNSNQLNLSALPTDIYTVQVYDGTEWYIDKLSIKK